LLLVRLWVPRGRWCHAGVVWPAAGDRPVGQSAQPAPRLGRIRRPPPV